MTLRVTKRAGLDPLRPTYTEPTQPTGVVLLGVTDTTATLRCNPSQATDNTTVILYRWYVDGASYVDSATPSVTLTGLTAETEYFVGVSAITSKNVESEQADAILVTTAQTPLVEVPVVAPTQPGSLADASGLIPNADYALIGWTASVSQDELPLLGYKIYRDGVFQGTTSGLYWPDAQVTPGQTYFYQVSAFTSSAESTKASVSITVPVDVVSIFAFLPITVPTGYRASQTIPAWTIGTINGQGNVTVSLYSGTMPPGMTILPDGTVPSISAPSYSQGTYNFTVRALDAQSQSITTALTVTIGYQQLTVTVGSIPSAAVSEVYAGIQGGISIIGGDASYTTTLRANTYFPLGLSLSGSGALRNVAGTCTGNSGQTYTAVLDITSGDGQSTEVTIVIPVQAVVVVELAASFPALGNFTVDTPYGNKAWTITGGTGPYTVTRTGPVPTGMSSNTTNAFTGTPTDGAGLTYSGSFLVSDSATPANFVVVPYSLVGNPAVAPPVTITLPTFDAAVPGSSYSETATASGGSTPYVWTYTGILPPGISFSGGVWTATAVGSSGAGNTYSGTVTCTPASGTADTKTWAITVDGLSAVWVAPSLTSALPDITVVANVSESNTYAVSSYVDAGDATDLVVGIEWVDTPAPGLSVSMVDADNFNISYDSVAGSNPSVDTDYDYRLSLTYTDPTGDPPITDNEADWVARSTGSGVLQVEDFRAYSSTAQMLANSDSGSNQTNATSANGGANYMVELDLTDGITAGRCLKITTFEGAGQQGGGFGRTYRSDGAAINGFYFQFAVKMNEAALYWEPAGSNSDGTADTKKIMQLESYGTGQVSVLAGTHGFPTLMVNGSQGTKRVISTGTGYGGDAFRQTAIDTGSTVISGNRASFAQRYGLSEGMTEAVNDYGPSGLVNQRGFEVPEPNAIIAGSVPYALDGWTVIEIYVYNDLSNNANDVFKMWAAPYGAAPKLVVDNSPGGAGTIEGGTLGVPGSDYYKRWEALNYPTRRLAETGRPAQVQKYDQCIPSTNWIPFPGHLTGTEP